MDNYWDLSRQIPLEDSNYLVEIDGVLTLLEGVTFTSTPLDE